MKDRIDLAIETAVSAHRKQHRKGTDIPYITHPMTVGILLARAGCPDDVIIAGILHDIVEDTPVTLDEIRDLFGENVAALVEGASEPDKTEPWDVRKRHTHEFLKEAPSEVKFIALADKLSNIRDIAADYAKVGEKVWERFSRGKKDQEWYYGTLVQSLRDESLDESYSALYRQFAEKVREVFDRK